MDHNEAAHGAQAPLPHPPEHVPPLPQEGTPPHPSALTAPAAAPLRDLNQRIDLTQVVQDLQDSAAAAVAPRTRTAYAADWARFTRWCTTQQVDPLPASAGLVAAYLMQAAHQTKPSGGPAYAMATLTRWLTSINLVHDERGLPRPSADARLGRVMKGLRRERGTRQRRVSPLLLDDVRQVLGAMAYTVWPGGLAATRDAALLLGGFAGAFRRSELAALRVGDLTDSRAEGVQVLVARSKTDQDGQGQIKALPFGRDPLTCPPCTLWRWVALVDAADNGRTRPTLIRDILTATPRDQHVCRDEHPDYLDDTRPLFRPITKGGAVGGQALSGHAVNDIVKKRVAAVGLNPVRFGGHSMRAGFVTEAFRHGQDAHAIKRQTGHKSDQVLEVYFRENAPFVSNAVTTLGL